MAHIRYTMQMSTLTELKPTPAEKYVSLLNEALGASGLRVTFEVSGIGFDLQTVLHIPAPILGKTMESIYRLRDQGFVCCPTFAPLDLHDLV